MAKVPTDKMLHFIVSLLLAIVASTIIANAIYNIMPDNPGARTATAYGATASRQAITFVGKTLRPMP